MGRLTTHVLDAAHGCPGSSIKVELYRVEGSGLELVATALTNSDGRCDAPLLEGEAYRSGVYQVQFSAGDYYRARGVKLPEPAFLDVV
ncbi:MAG: hydroxyisourate hydrolase, partial [Pseudomonas sp.]|nr:hydroxyisourate hydrolase [Pseudomonas sp.]